MPLIYCFIGTTIIYIFLILDNTGIKKRGVSFMIYDLEFWNHYMNQNIGKINIKIRRYFPNDTDLAEEAISFTLERISAKLKQYDPKKWKSPDAFIFACIPWEIKHFKEKHFGRFRPPKSLIKMNNLLWIETYKLICKDKMADNEIIEYLKTNSAIRIEIEKIEEAIAVIKEKYPNCIQETIELSDEVDQNFTRKPKNENPETVIIDHQVKMFIQIITANVQQTIPQNPPVFKMIDKIAKKIKPEHKVFLRLIFEDGLNSREAGEKLGWNVDQSNGVYRRLMEKLAPLKKYLIDFFEE
jgi:hypothetical protein